MSYGSSGACDRCGSVPCECDAAALKRESVGKGIPSHKERAARSRQLIQSLEKKPESWTYTQRLKGRGETS